MIYLNIVCNLLEFRMHERHIGEGGEVMMACEAYTELCFEVGFIKTRKRLPCMVVLKYSP